MGVAVVLAAPTLPLDLANVCAPSELTTKFGDWEPASTIIVPGVPTPVKPVLDSGERPASMRILIGAQNLGTGDWSLSIRDHLGHLVAQLDRSDFADTASTVWTGRIAGPDATLLLRGASAAAVLEVRGTLANGPAGSDEVAFSVRNPSGIPTWRFLYPGLTRDSPPRPEGSVPPAVQLAGGEAVGIFVDQTLSRDPALPDGSRNSWCCSGVMIGRDLYLTNWHCAGPGQLWDGEVKSNAIIDLAWDNGSARRQFKVVDVVAKDPARDFAILRIAPANGADAAIRSVYPVPISTEPLRTGQGVMMIHHAQCSAKLISDNCIIDNADRHAWTDPRGTTGVKSEITHTCDTEPGASGAPIFDLQGRLVALHHLGFQKASGPLCQADFVNKAVKIGAIVECVRMTAPALARELNW
jgi:V8-like Glu-specific endopeptidase